MCLRTNPNPSPNPNHNPDPNPNPNPDPNLIRSGGPTGVEFAAELNDFLEEDVPRMYPELKV